MKEIAIRLGAREAAILLSAALLFGGGFATVSAFNGGATTQGLPMVLPYQGTLAKDGMPVDGTQPNVIFKLHDSEAGAVELWSSDSRTLDVKDGRFAVTLGDAHDTRQLQESFFREPALYVSINIDGTELSPRQRIAPTPQALAAAKAAQADQALAAAGELQSDLTALTQASSDHSTRLLGIEASAVRSGTGTSSNKSISTFGSYCGETAPTTGEIVFPFGASNPSLRGLEAAKAHCEAAAGCSSTAHMCTTHEMAISASVRQVPATTATWVMGTTSEGANLSCFGYTESAHANAMFGTTFYRGEGGGFRLGSFFFNTSLCTDMRPIACCQ